MTQDGEKKGSLVRFLKRFGVLGFTFFLVKGLIWLAVLFFGTKAIL